MMPTSRNLLELQEHNRLQLINQVPHELLSHIFLLYDLSTSYAEEPPKTYVQFVAPAVCHYWRKVAVGTTALWTTIRLLRPVPCKRAELYLSRSGSTVPLDIRILAMSPESTEGDGLRSLEVHAERARKIFSFIIEHGGPVSRWRGLGITTDIFAFCAVVTDFLASTYLPSLESLDFGFVGPWVDHFDDEQMFSDAYGGDETPKLLFSRPPPRLRSVKLEGIMNPHLFGNMSRPQLVGLTDIDISFAEFHPSINQIRSMLAANPRLVKLCFNSGDTDIEEFYDMSALPRIVLSDLVSLTFMHIMNPTWNLSVLKTFQAPALQNLELSFWAVPQASQILVDFIAHQCKNLSAYFPATLNELSFFTVMEDNPNPEPLFRAYPGITTLRTGSLSALLIRPWLVPNLVNLDAPMSEVTQVKNVILGRCGDGLPLKTVGLRWYGEDGTLPLSQEDKKQLEKLVDLTIRARELPRKEEGENPDSPDHAG